MFVILVYQPKEDFNGLFNTKREVFYTRIPFPKNITK